MTFGGGGDSETERGRRTANLRAIPRTLRLMQIIIIIRKCRKSMRAGLMDFFTTHKPIIEPLFLNVIFQEFGKYVT